MKEGLTLETKFAFQSLLIGSKFAFCTILHIFIFKFRVFCLLLKLKFLKIIGLDLIFYLNFIKIIIEILESI
jgi:hypothetical protein